MGIKIDGWELPEHVSYSSFTTYLDCGWLYVLTRGARITEQPAWWFIGGNTLHEATEQLDKEWALNVQQGVITP